MLKSVIISGYLAIIIIGAAFAVPPMLDSGIMEHAMREVIKGLKKDCDDKGHPEVFNNVQNENAITLCMMSTVNVSQLHLDMISPKAEERAEELSEKFCNLVDERRPSCTLMVEAVKVCTPPEQQKIAANMAPIQNRMDDYACNNHGEKLISFIKNSGVTCFTTKAQELFKCVNKVDFQALLSFEEEQCKKIDEVQACIEGVVETCKLSVRQELNSLINYVKEATPCHNKNDTVNNETVVSEVTKSPQSSIKPIAPLAPLAPLAPDCVALSAISKLENIEKILQREDDEFDKFGKYIASSLRTLGSKNRVSAQFDILNILTKHKMQNIEENEMDRRLGVDFHPIQH